MSLESPSTYGPCDARVSGTFSACMTNHAMCFPVRGKTHLSSGFAQLLGALLLPLLSWCSRNKHTARSSYSSIKSFLQSGYSFLCHVPKALERCVPKFSCCAWCACIASFEKTTRVGKIWRRSRIHWNWGQSRVSYPSLDKFFEENGHKAIMNMTNSNLNELKAIHAQY